MSKFRFVIVAVIAMAMLVVPGAAMARQHSGHKTKHAKRHKRHTRIHHGATANSQGPSETQSSNGSVEVRNSSVVSFDSTTGRLTITVPGSQTLSGNVTNATEIECEAADEQGPHEHGQSNDRRTFKHGAESSGDTQADEQNGSGNEQNDDGAENDGDADEQGPQSQQCSTANLTPGAQISQAELDGNGDFTKVELVR